MLNKIKKKKKNKKKKQNCWSFLHLITVADPGFPVGGANLIGGGANSRGGYVLKNLYVKMKESGPLGGVHTGGAPPDPPVNHDLKVCKKLRKTHNQLSYKAQKKKNSRNTVLKNTAQGVHSGNMFTNCKDQVFAYVTVSTCYPRNPTFYSSNTHCSGHKHNVVCVVRGPLK